MLQVSSGVEGCVLETLWWSGDSLLENTQGKGREGGERGAGGEGERGGKSEKRFGTEGWDGCECFYGVKGGIGLMGLACL